MMESNSQMQRISKSKWSCFNSYEGDFGWLVLDYFFDKPASVVGGGILLLDKMFAVLQEPLI